MPLVIAGAVFLIYLAAYSLYFNTKIDSMYLPIERTFDMKSAPVGRKISYKIGIPRNIPYDFKIRDIVPEKINIIGEKELDSQKYTKEKNEPFSFYELRQAIDSTQKGFYPIGPTKMIFHDGMGLFYREKILSNIDNVLFYLTISSGKKLDIALRRKVTEFTQGLRKSWYKGAGTNFMDLRLYAPGDDIRLIDWKTTAKKENLHVKEFEEEKRQRVLLLIDIGKRMFGGSPKIIMDSSIKAAMLLSYIILSHRDYLGCATFSSTIKSYLKFDIGKKQYKKLINLFSAISYNDETDFKNSLKYLKKIYKKNALIIIISTLSNKEESMAAIKKLRATGNAVIVFHPFEPLFSGKQANNYLEKIILDSLNEKFKIDIEKIKHNFQKIGIPLIAVGPDDFEDMAVKQYIKTLNKNLQAIYS